MQAQVRLGRLRRPSRIYLRRLPPQWRRPLACRTRGSQHRDMTKPSRILPFCTVALALMPALQAIARDPVTGVYTGASESRKDGHAAGY